MKRSSFVVLAVGLALLLGGNQAQADVITITASESGWYDSTGSHDSTNSNYLAGSYQGVGYHNYFVFDLSSLPAGATITAAKLLLDNPRATTTSGQSYVLDSVNVPISTLEAGHTSQLAPGVYTALGSGTLFASTTALSNSTVKLSLDQAALLALGQAAGGEIAFGGFVPGANGQTDYVFGFSGDGPVELRITYSVPEPGSLFVICLGVTGIGAFCWRRRKAIAEGKSILDF